MFFTPENWDNSSDTLRFKTKGDHQQSSSKKSAPISMEAKANKKPSKQKKKKAKKPSDSEPSTSLGSEKKKVNSNKERAIKEGRVEKLSKKQKKAQKLKQKAKPEKKNLLLKNAGASSSVTVKTKPAAAATDDQQTPDDKTNAKTSLKERLQEQLMGGRFRYLNEQLYTMDSSNAVKLFQEDKAAFDAYHAGYRHQVEKWPMNPLKRIIKTIRRLPKSLVIGDFGCGEGKLAESVVRKVYSMDLVSCRPDIIACDMAHTPLESQSLDVAVYCLSLMGTNLRDHLMEANRVLKINGLVLIAEIQSRFDDIRHFVRFMEACGFELIKKDTNTKVFYFFEFKKTRNIAKVAIIPDYELKPCLYRKR